MKTLSVATWSIRKKLALLIGLSFIIRCILAAVIEFNNDEVYYWTYAQQLQWNYFDHPPGIAVLLKITTVNLLFQQAFFCRLGPILCCAACTWLIFLIGKKIKNESAGLIAAVLYTASPYCSIIAGMLVLPDAPQLVFWLLSVLLMLNIVSSHRTNRSHKFQFIALGVCIGCCILCKVHGIFLWVGMLSFILLFKQRLLRNPFLYCSIFITAFISSPILFWNLSNNFVTYRFHSDRVSFFGRLQPDVFARELFGEILYNNPFVFAVVVVAVIAVFKRKELVTLSDQQKLLLCTSLPMIALVLLMSLFRDTLPHWTGPAYTALLPLAASFLVWQREETHSVRWSLRMQRFALGLTVFLLGLVFIMLQSLPAVVPVKDKEKLGDGDPLLDMSGYQSFGSAFHTFYQQQQHVSHNNKRPVIFSDNWFPAAHFEYYVARNSHAPFMAVGSLSSIHQYAWRNTASSELDSGCDAYYITISNNFHPLPAYLQNAFQEVLPPVKFTQHRNGQAVRYFYVYPLRNYTGSLPENGVIDSRELSVFERQKSIGTEIPAKDKKSSHQL